MGIVQPMELTGVLGWAEGVMQTLGEWGVAALVLLETVFPPIPSEAILPLAGYFTQRGDLVLPLVIVAATAGAYVGALGLYALGAALGLERSIRWLAKIPLMDREDLESAAGWFERHGRASVFFGRLIPGVRSLISLPAGAERMNLLTFSACTIAGSGLWNGLLVGLGAWLGDQYVVVERYSHYLDYAFYAFLAAGIGGLVIRKVRRRRATRQPADAR